MIFKWRFSKTRHKERFTCELINNRNRANISKKYLFDELASVTREEGTRYALGK